MKKYEHDLIVNFLKQLWSLSLSSKVFLMASPSWGKTYLVREILQRLHPIKIVFVSPLLAINEELKKKIISEKIEIEDFERLRSRKYGIICVTPEKLAQIYQKTDLLEWADLFIIDECHLWPLWRSFRYQLDETWMLFSQIEKRCLLLSGTFDFKNWSKSDVGQVWIQNNNEVWSIDLHRGSLLTKPKRKIMIPSSFKIIQIQFLKWMLRFTRLKVLIFFPLRSQVENWARWCKNNNINVLHCVGGQTTQFVSSLESCHNSPHVIIATSTLSHGVNLPPRDWIFIFGSDWEREIWLQMISRGGRNGESFSVISEVQKTG